MSKQRIFEVGDKVRSPLWKGVSIVVENLHEEGSELITVKDPISTGIYHRFYSNGLRYGEYEPSLRHAYTGIPAIVGEPPERFEYPLYMTNGCYIVEFTGLTFGTVMANDNGLWNIGHSTDIWTSHTNRDIWTPCDKPKWKPTKPTWCWVWDTYRADAMRRLVRPTSQSDKKNMYYVTPRDSKACYSHAEPCESKDIPDYWPEEWV